MARESEETRLVRKMRKKAEAVYGDRLVVIKQHGSQFTEPGVSDLLCSLDGLFVAIEAKSPASSTHKRATVEASIEHALTHGPTVKQRLFVARVLAGGGCAGFAATIEQFMEILAHAEGMADGTAPHPCRGHNLRESN